MGDKENSEFPSIMLLLREKEDNSKNFEKLVEAIQSSNNVRRRKLY